MQADANLVTAPKGTTIKHSASHWEYVTADGKMSVFFDPRKRIAVRVGSRTPKRINHETHKKENHER